MKQEHSIPEEVVNRIKSETKIELVANQFLTLKKKGKDYKGPCPFCSSSDAFSVSVPKQVAKCFSCGEAPDVFGIVVRNKNCTFLEAVKIVAEISGVQHLLDDIKKPKANPTTQPKKAPQGKKQSERDGAPVPLPEAEVIVQDEKVATLPEERKKKASATAVRQTPKAKPNETFRDAQLRLSGITEAMQRGKVFQGEVGGAHWPDFDRYETATLDYRKDWALVPGVDMVMHYINLERQLITYIPEKEGKSGQDYMRQSGSKPRPMRRVRFQNPDAHEFDGKYASPSGSGQHLWLPNALIDLWEKPAAHVRTFIVTEGEKKADRGAKELAATAGIMGIHNLAKIHGPLPPEFERLFEKLDTEDVVYFMDGDLWDLGSCTNGNVQFRPQIFAAAVNRFRSHFDRIMVNGHKVRTHLAHVNSVAAKEKGFDNIKGLDDLLESGLMTGDEYRTAINRGILGHQHEFIQFYNIGELDDFKVKQLWHLTDKIDFAEHYREAIVEKGVERFKLGKHFYKFDESGKVVLDQPMAEDEVFFTKEKNERGKYFVQRDTDALHTFLNRRGFFRMVEKIDKTHFYVRVIDNVMERVSVAEIRDFIIDFLYQVVKEDKLVKNFFKDNHQTHLSDNTFVTMDQFHPSKLRDQKDRKYFTFKDQIWDVTKDRVQTIPLRDMPANVWNTQLIDQSPTYTGPLFHIRKIDWDVVDATEGPMRKVYALNVGLYIIQITEAGKKCEFLKFLINSSNFHWKKSNPREKGAKREELTPEEQFEIQQHLIAKLTGMGHLIHKHRSADTDYDLYAMEGILVEGQRSEGGSGKSLIAKVLKPIFPSIYFIDGKRNLEIDNFLYAGVNSETQFIWYDDFSKPNKIDFLYTKTDAIGFPVRRMQKESIMLPYEDSPRGYITSNFNLLDNQGSTKRRFAIMLFSDFYSADHTPADEHGHLFWHDWGPEQMNLYFSLLADCSRVYLQEGGVVEAPSERADLRRWHSEIGQQFCDWADATFLVPSQNGGVAERTGIKVTKADAYGVMKEGRYVPDWSYRAQAPNSKFMTETVFKRKLWVWALLRGLIINPGVKNTMVSMKSEFGHLDYGGDMKPGGVECVLIVERGQPIQKGIYGRTEND